MNDRDSFKNRLIANTLPVLVLLAANLIVFHDYWTADRLFSGKDLLTAFGPLLNFQTDCLQEGSLPLWNPFLNFGYPFVEHYSNTMFFPTHLLMGLVTGSSMELIQREMLFWMFLGGLGTYLCARELGRNRTTAVIAGMSFMFCGQILSLPHWHLLVYNAACFPYLLLGYYRAKRTGDSLSLIAVLFLTFALFGGHITTSVLGIYMFSGFVLIDSLFDRRFLFGLRFLVVTGIIAGLLALPKLAPMFEALRSGPRMLQPAPTGPVQPVTDAFNVINSYQFMSLLLPVKYFFSLYVGQFCVLAAAFALFRRQLRINSLLVMCVLASWFLAADNQGNWSLLRSAANMLPFMKLVRNEWFEWFHPSLFLILYLTGAVEAFLAGPFERSHVMAAGLFAALLTACYLLAYNTAAFAVPFGERLALAVLFLTLPLLHKRKQLQFGAAAGLVLLDFFLVFSFVAPDQAPVRNDTQLRIAVLDQGSMSKSFRDDNQVYPNFYAIATQDRLRPPVSASVNWPVLQSGLHGAPFINFAPEQYGMFIDDMNLKRFSGWWYNAQERFDFIRLKDSPLLARMEGLPLFAFLDHAGNAIPADTAFDAVSCSSLAFSVRTSEPGLFLLHQMHDARWQVQVNGKPEQILRVNDFFMGVNLGPGEHRLSFVFRDRIYIWALAISGATLFGIIVRAVVRRGGAPTKRHTDRTHP